MLPNLAPFLTFVLLSSFTPGPNNIMAMTLAGKSGFFRCFSTYILGMFIGCMLLSGLSAFFCLTLFSFIPKIEPYMRWVGAAYIFWLAWLIWRDKPGSGKKAYLRPDSALTGVIMQFLNVKGILYFVVSFSNFIIPHYDHPAALALFSLLLSLVACVATSSWALAGAALQRVFTAHRKLSNLIMALLLAYCGVSLLL